MIDDVKTVRRWRAGGRASAGGFNAVRDAVADMQSSMIHGSNGAGGMTNRPPFTGKGYQLAYIVSSVSIADARWQYTVQFCSFADSTTLQADAVRGTVTAVNGVEFAHTAETAAALPWTVWGVDAHDTGDGNTISLTPTAVQENTLVHLYKSVAADGTHFYYFFAVGGFTSECT